MTKRKWALAIGLTLVVLVALGLWWRMSGIIVQVNEAALKALPPVPAGGPVEFTAMTYNIQARPWFDDSKHKFKYISPLTNASDICAFQECFKDHARLWAAAEHPVKVYHATLKHPFKIVGSGLSILGKFPLTRTDGINFRDAGDEQNWPASKGSLMASFDLGGMPLDVYTTHIAAGKKPASLLARKTQVDELIAFVRSHSPADRSFILMADFNMRPSRGPEDKAANKDNPKITMFDHLVSELGARDASDEINGPTGEEIDRVLFRPGTGVTMTPLSWKRDTPEYYDPEGVPLSDHKPVFVRFRMQKQ